MDDQINHSFLERMKYNIQRHAMSIILVLAAVLILSIVGNMIWIEDNAHAVIGGILRLGFGMTAVLLFTKFAYPKLSIQESINNGNIAVAIFAGLVAVAIALLF